jgi:ankyrin repeat protein
MMIACKLGRIKSVQLLLEDQRKQQATLDPKDKDYQHYASFYSYMDTQGPYQNTPLHYAAKHNQVQIVKALVEAGAQLELKNFYNDTPFSVACAQGNLEIAEYLLEKGANIHG